MANYYGEEPYGEEYQTTTREVQPDGSIIERTETTRPDGTKVIEETIHKAPRHGGPDEYGYEDDNGYYDPPHRNASGPDAPLPSQYPPQRRRAPASNGVQHQARPQQQQGPVQNTNSVGGDIPRFGASAECPPRFAPRAKTGRIDWAWFPEFSWINVLLYTCMGVALIGLLLLITGAAGGNTALLVVGLILFLLGFVGLFITGIWRWNATKQEAYMLARGKQLEAVALWRDVDRSSAHEAKDNFFETKYGGKTLRVLRDGTIEVYGSHRTVQYGGADAGGLAESAAEGAVQGLANA